MTPEESKFRERRSAFTDDDGETAGPRPEPPEPADAGAGRSGEPIIETPGGAPPAGSVEEGSAVGSRPGREPGAAAPGSREEARRPGAAPGPGETPGSTAAAPEPAAAEPAEGGIDFDRLDRMEIPEPSFYEILQPLEIQALQFLGVAPLTESGEKRVLPRWAKHVIDLLGLIEERTRGNLPEEEAAYLERVLTELRTRYVKVTS